MHPEHGDRLLPAVTRGDCRRDELATVSSVAGESEVDESNFGGVRKGKRGPRRRRESPRVRAVEAWGAKSTG